MDINEVQQWVSDMNKGTAMLLLIIISARLVAAALELQLSDAECAFLKSLQFKGRLSFQNVENASTDFGKLVKAGRPRAVLYPTCVDDIATLMKAINKEQDDSSRRASRGKGLTFNLTVAARGNGHSIHGQAQAAGGVVVDMSSMRGRVDIHPDAMCADVSGGELWIDVLHACLPYGLAPCSWTDYLYLTVGGTLSNAGISGQAFRHGPQINNVMQLQVVTGKGDIVTCSETENSDLFYGVLGGLGQFGIITRARIALERAPQRVKWIRALYSDFDSFRKDQEYLISQPPEKTFDYVEGFVVPNTDTSVLENWKSSLFQPLETRHVVSLQKYDAANALQTQQTNSTSTSPVLYYLEVAKNYNEGRDAEMVDQEVDELLSNLHCMSSSIYSMDISYSDFLNRVYVGEMKLREKGLWDIPHPWLNLFIPASKVAEFDSVVFKKMLGKKGTGPIIVYPMNRDKWNERMSVAIPDGESVFYLVALLRAPTGVSGEATTEDLVQQNEAVLQFCERNGIGEKQYLPHIHTPAGWQRHFGDAKWTNFVRRKATYDPNALLAPSQNIFRRQSWSSSYKYNNSTEVTTSTILMQALQLQQEDNVLSIISAGSTSNSTSSNSSIHHNVNQFQMNVNVNIPQATATATASTKTDKPQPANPSATH